MGFNDFFYFLYKYKKFTVLFFIFGALLFACSVYYHELAHSEVFRSYNIESTTHYGSGKSYVSPNATQYYKNCNENCILAENMVDVIGYQLMSLWALIFLCVLFIIYIIEDLKFNADYELGERWK